jgi:alpha-L-rhamnosidase
MWTGKSPSSNGIKTCILLVILLCIIQGKSQTISSAVLKDPWKAWWITGPGPRLNRNLIETDESIRNYSVLKFRKSFDLAVLPASFIVHTSADNRYKLFVNGKLVSLGPARGDLYFWNFETIDIAPYLKQGKNTLAALLWNFADLRPEAQITYRTAFILQGNSPIEEVANTDTTWRVVRDSSYQPLRNLIPGYYVAGPGEIVHMQQGAKGWETTNYSDTTWSRARLLAPGLTKEASVDAAGWMLVPSGIPQMELTVQRLKSLSRVEGITVAPGFPAAKTEVLIPAHTTAALLLDAGQLTNAYPTFLFREGKGAGISLGYAESLFIPDTAAPKDNPNGPSSFIKTIGKGNRNEVEGKVFIGTKDSIVSDGSKDQNFTSLWWRTYRYIQLRVTTKEEPLVIEDLYGTFTGFPFKYKAKLESNDSLLSQILEIGWRTARLCAFESYMDCPYYEQLQYIGDTRIQALISYYNSGDDRLARSALDQMDQSRIAEGITLSRWPSYTPQQIPTFSLWYIGMLYDYYLYRSDSLFVQEKLPGTRQILSWFSRYQGEDGSLKDVPYWIFTDWRSDSGWIKGMAPVGKKGESAVLDLQLLWTYQLAAQMETSMGLQELAKAYRTKVTQLKTTIQRKYWDASKGLYADTKEKDKYSQHTNSLVILSGMLNKEQALVLGKKLLSDTTLTSASIYFKYYLHQALVKAGLGNSYLDWLGIWKENIRQGLTTWAEMSDVNNSRSDCHAWGASPNIELFRTILGIDSDAPGFRKVRIQPHLGSLTNIGGEIPHPAGIIAVRYWFSSKWQISINLPQQVNGTFIWKGKSYALRGGRNIFQL